jgi:integrase
MNLRFPLARLFSNRGIENVSRLLGHQSVRATEKHYSPWVKTREDALDKAVEKVLRFQEISATIWRQFQEFYRIDQ